LWCATATSPIIGQCRKKGAQFPVVLVAQEIFGAHERIFKDLCRRFAKLDYLAVAPELSEIVIYIGVDIWNAESQQDRCHDRPRTMQHTMAMVPVIENGRSQELQL